MCWRKKRMMRSAQPKKERKRRGKEEKKQGKEHKKGKKQKDNTFEENGWCVWRKQMMCSGQTDDVFEANRPSVLHRHDDAWFSEFIIFASHLNLYTLHKALRYLYPQRLRKDIGWKLCKKSKYLQLWQCKHLPSNGLRTEKCSFSHDYTEEQES